MKAGYLRAPFEFEVRDVQLREPDRDEVLVRIKASGFCGSDRLAAEFGSREWQSFGHEMAGIIEAVGADVTDLKVGDKVTIQSSSFSQTAEVARNGRVDLDRYGPNYIMPDLISMGFAEYAITKAYFCVKFDGISFEEACMIEPLGVAEDLVVTADVKINDDVLIVGLGSIGLMTMQLAKARGARKVYAAMRSGADRRYELAKELGADEIIITDQTSLVDYPFEKGGVDKVLIAAATPTTIPDSLKVCNIGAIIAFISIVFSEAGEGGEALVPLDCNLIHRRKMQLRGSNAIPALYFPRCLDLVKAGKVNIAPLVSHRCTLDNMVEVLNEYINDRKGGVKAILVQD